MPKAKQFMVSRLPNVTVIKHHESLPLEAVVGEIKGTSLVKHTAELHMLYTNGSMGVYKKKKSKLPAVIFAGVFTEPNNAGLHTHSGLLVLDFDGIEAELLHQTKQKLASDPHTALVYTSPSNHGFKWIVAVKACDEQTHKQCWRSAANYALKTFSLEADPSGKDVSRKSFLCHDDEVVFREPIAAFSPLDSTNAPILGDTGGLGDGGDMEIPWLFSPASFIKEFLPTKPKQNHNDCLLRLGQRVKLLEMKRNGSFSSSQIDALIEVWYQSATPAFRPNSLDDYQNEFQDMLKAIRSTGEAGYVVQNAWHNALENPPKVAVRFHEEKRATLGELASLCYHLGKIHNGEFFLAQMTVAKLQDVTQSTVSGNVARLERDGLIRQTRRADRAKKKAAYYVWIGGE